MPVPCGRSDRVAARVRSHVRRVRDRRRKGAGRALYAHRPRRARLAQAAREEARGWLAAGRAVEAETALRAARFDGATATAGRRGAGHRQRRRAGHRGPRLCRGPLIRSLPAARGHYLEDQDTAGRGLRKGPPLALFSESPSPAPGSRARPGLCRRAALARKWRRLPCLSFLYGHTYLILQLTPSQSS